MTDEEWRRKLTPAQYRVLREKGTETPFTGEFLYHTQDGTYRCAGCGAELFKSEHKYDSAIPGLEGWPSFADVASAGAVKLTADTSYGMDRVEAQCAKCGGHLGHLFPDDSSPSGSHYCINSVALDFSRNDQVKPSEHLSPE